MRIAVGITFYYPREIDIDKIDMYSSMFDKVYVYDNAFDSNINLTQRFKKYKNVYYICNHSNDGLPKAFNYILKTAYKDKMDYLCTLDQDSLFLEEEISKIKTWIQKNRVDSIAMVCPAIRMNGKAQKSNECTEEKVNWSICSGSFFNLHILKKEEIWFDEYYFIDRFDKDICEAIMRKGYEIIRLNNVHLDQELGVIKNGHANHSSLRHYYIFRNRFYYNQKFYNRTLRYSRNIVQTFHHIYLILRHEEKKIEKIIVLKKAIVDYKNHVYGPMIDN